MTAGVILFLLMLGAYACWIGWEGCRRSEGWPANLPPLPTQPAPAEKPPSKWSWVWFEIVPPALGLLATLWAMRQSGPIDVHITRDDDY